MRRLVFIISMAICVIPALSFGEGVLDTGKVVTAHSKSPLVRDTLKNDTVKKATVKKDTVKVDPDLHLTINKSDALVYLIGLNAAYLAAPESDVISAKQGTRSKEISGYLIGLIYKKWPDLIPKAK